MYLIFDTETTGLATDFKAPMSKLDNWPRVIELAFQVYDKDHNLIHSYSPLIKPDGWVVPIGKFWSDNNFTNDRNMKDGIPISEALKEFVKWHDQCEYMVAHNISYDYNVLGAEFIRAKMRATKKLKQICTKDSTTKFCNLPGKYGKAKWPTLGELYNKLFNEVMGDAHKADVDVANTAKCLFECLNRKIIKL